MLVKQKSEHVIQAQQAAFAAEALGSFEDRELVRSALGSSGVATEAILANDLAETDFPDYLRQVGGQRHEGISRRTAMLDNYARFAPAVAELKAKLDPLDDRSQHDAFLGAGGNMRAFTIEVVGKRYVVREAIKGKNSLSSIDARMAAGVLTKGVPHLEQVVAASFDDREVIVEHAPGKTLNNLSLEELRNVSHEQVDDLVEATIAMHEHGATFDSKPGNILYDTEAGYTLIDLESKRGQSVPSVWRGKSVVAELVGVVSAVKTGGTRSLWRSGTPKTSGDYQDEYAVLAATLDITSRFIQTVVERLPEVQATDFLKRMDFLVSSDFESAEDYEAFWRRIEESLPAQDHNQHSVA